MEAPGGFEPPIKVLQTYALPLGYGAGARGGTALAAARQFPSLHVRGSVSVCSMPAFLSIGPTAWLAIFAGGGLGACLRIALSAAIDGRLVSAFPFGLLAVNALGCFAIGLLTSFADEHGWLGPTLRAFAVAGVLGGFTTFSSFGLDTVRLAADGRLAFAAANAIGSVLLALAGVAAGISLARSLG